MTMTVLIGTQGNKAVKITTPNGEFLMQPGRWYTQMLSGDQVISITEHGDFIDNVEPQITRLEPTLPAA